MLVVGGVGGDTWKSCAFVILKMHVKYIYTRDVNKVHGLFNALFCFVPIANSITSAYLYYALIHIENLE
jgi:hypothetical protein